MIENGKYKISNLAKDLKLKNKDIIDLLEKIGFPGRTHSSVLTAEEYSVLMNYYTTNSQIIDINGYMDKKTVIADPAVVRLTHAPAAKPSEKKPEKPTVKPKPDAPKSVQGIQETQPEKLSNKPEAKPQNKPTAAASEPVGVSKTNVPRTDAHKKPAQAMSATENARPRQKKDDLKEKQQKIAERRAKEEQKKPQDRFVNPLAAHTQQNAANKAAKKNNKDKSKERPQTQQLQRNVKVQTGVTTSTDSAVSSYTGSKAGTRVIDTRTVNVDLAKYDEKLEKLATDQKNRDENTRQKLKKQNNNGNKGGRSDFRSGKQPFNKKKDAFKPVKQQISITVGDEITVGELASRLKATAAEVIKRLMMLGVMANVNQVVDYDTAEYVATELGAKISREVVVTIEDKLFDDHEDGEEELSERAPVVCVMGHVDHGKTSILDRIRHTNVTAGEAGGITQHIGAYRVTVNGKDITFLDTPGHEAFTAMRARGAMATDIAILVVAADDGIMPQTIEAINHAKAADIDIIVAINKMDKPGADPENIKQEMTKYGLVPEEWGGDTICVPVSALTGMGMEDLLENVLLVAEVKGLRANPNRRAKGIVIEARLDKGRGPVATVLVQNGTLNTGDVVIAGTAVGRVRAMTNDKGRTIKTAGPSVPVEIIGLSEVPDAGDEFAAVQDEKMARELVEQRKQKSKEAEFKANAKVSLDDLFAQISDGAKELNIIVKADVGGSAEAVKASLLKLSNVEVKVNVIHSAVGGITEGDVMLATASNAIIVGFNVRPDKGALDSAERQKVDIRTYRIIYECIEEIEAAMKGMLAPKFKESLLGHAEVRQTIHVPNVGTIAGSYITDGKVIRSAQIRVLREGIVIFEDKISSLRRFKDDVKEVAQGYECGIGLDRFNDIKEGDILEAFEMVQV